MAEYTKEQLAEFVEIRARDIREIEALWARLCVLRDEPPKRSTLDAWINETYSVGDGRNCLGYESIESVKTYIKQEIAKEEEKNGKHS